MNRFSLPFYLLGKELKSSPATFIRQWILFSLIFAIVIVLFVMPESYRFLRVAPYELANYDFQVSGELREKEFKKVQNCPQIDKVVGVIEWNGLGLENLGNGKQHEAPVLFANNITVAADISPNNNALLMKGTYKENGAVLTYGLSKKLGAKIGDEIQIDWSSFERPEYKVKYTITGISYETAAGEQMVADMNVAENTLNEVSKKVANRPDPIKYSYFYATFKANNDMELESISKLLGNLSIESRLAMLEEEERVVQQLSAQVQYQRYGILILYLLVICGYTLITIREKERFFAITMLLGAKKSFPYYYLLLGNMFLFVVVTLSSVILSYHFYRYFLEFYFPVTILLHLIFYAAFINLAILLIASYFGLQKLNKLNIVDILAKE